MSARRRRPRPLALAALLVPLLAGACRRDIRLLPGDAGGAGTPGSAGTTGGAGAAGHAGATGSAGRGGAGVFGGAGAGGARADGGQSIGCGAPGAPQLLPTAAGSVCASALAARGHRFALCSCDMMTTTSRIRTDAFDSTNPSVQDEVSAAVGVDGPLLSTAEVRAGGAIYVAGSVHASDHLQSGASLRVGAALAQLDSNTDVAGDAFVGGDVSGSVRVNGTLHMPPTAGLGVDVEAAGIVREEVSVASPCDCSDGFVDVTAAIATVAANSDDAAAGFAPTALANVTAPARIDVSCGSYTLDRIDAQAAITLTVHGRARLAIAGDVIVRAGLAVELDAGAELDLLVAGRVAVSGSGSFGTTSAPARFRVWIAGTTSLVLDDGATVGAVIHAPGAVVIASAGLTLYGSLLARSLTLGADAAIHFDRAILSAGAACGEPAAAVVP